MFLVCVWKNTTRESQQFVQIKPYFKLSDTANSLLGHSQFSVACQAAFWSNLHEREKGEASERNNVYCCYKVSNSQQYVQLYSLKKSNND